jgi:hypothetical protein
MNGRQRRAARRRLWVLDVTWGGCAPMTYSHHRNVHLLFGNRYCADKEYKDGRDGFWRHENRYKSGGLY